jgi:hypothetical protein
MPTIQAIQTVNGPTLSIAVPSSFEGKQVRIVVSSVDDYQELDEETRENRIHELTLEKPEVSPELRQRLLDDPDLLKPLGYDDPFGPACPPEDWEALS